ncbi:hypothetical protein Pelo_17437 [Pelomyxa schiedti]|nr:hypothetical protein Pelo_17437 [Pelomyxa schiedti]
MAKQLVDGGGGGYETWSGCRLLTWPKDDPSLIYDIREVPNCTSTGSVLYLACKGGNLDVVKWVMSKFRGVGTEPWELPMPFHAAVRWGHLYVVKWLASTTGVIAACRLFFGDDRYPDLGEFIASPSLEVMKFCTDLFFGYGMKFTFKAHGPLCGGKPSLKKLHTDFFAYVENVKGFKWAIENLSIKPTECDLKFACGSLGDEDLVKWLLENHTDTVGSVTVDIFNGACGNRSDSVSLVELLFLKLAQPLTPPPVADCLVESLYHNNAAVADWLERKFHVMDHVNTSPSVTEQIFKKICSLVINISEEVVTECFSASLGWGFIKTALLLWEKFDVSRRSFDKAQTVSSIVYFCDISQAQKFLLHFVFSAKL